MANDDYIRDLIYDLKRQYEERERIKNEPPRTIKARTAGEIINEARALIGQHHYPIDSLWMDRKRWSREEASWLAFGIDPGVVKPKWRLYDCPQEQLCKLANELACVLDGFLEEGESSPGDYINLFKKLEIDSSWGNEVEADRPKKRHGNTRIYENRRKECLGAALHVLAKYPEECKGDRGDVTGEAITSAVIDHAALFWESGKPPIGYDRLKKLIQGHLNKKRK